MRCVVRGAVRRRLVASLWLAAWAPVARAQAEAPVPARPFQIGWLTGGSSADFESAVAFRDGLRGFGWVQGRHYVLLARFAEGRLAALDALAVQLVADRADLIIATTPSALVAAQKATSTLPIVMLYGPDPAESGAVARLARPGGNVTGLTSLSAELSVKQLELLRAIVPGVTRVAVLWNPGNPWHPAALQRVRAATQAMGGHLVEVAVRAPEELQTAFDSITQARAAALLSLSDPMTIIHRARLAALAIQHRLPSMHGVGAYVDAGGLASYWPNDAAMRRRLASYVFRILGQGAKPSDLPIEQPTRFELVINLKTAKQLGIQVPSSVMARADRTIE